jgi:hypothetical protein
LLEQLKDAGPAQALGLEVQQEVKMPFDDAVENGRLTGDRKVGSKASERGL